MNVFPNPAADYITVELKGDIHDSYIEIFDVTGCLITKTAALNHSQLNISNLPGGIYIIKAGDSIAKFSKY